MGIGLLNPQLMMLPAAIRLAGQGVGKVTEGLRGDASEAEERRRQGGG